MSTQTDLTVRKTLTVNCSPERAFEVFTAGMASWWPFETHSTSDERPEAVVIEAHEGGRVYERLADGKESDWATVTAWEPPSLFAVKWHVTSGKPETQLEVRFLPEGDGTRVELTHGGWERYGREAAEAFDSYNGGWDTVLRPYVEAANG
jgi:uncharacterized protein YndB with AHSA1/START domain